MRREQSRTSAAARLASASASLRDRNGPGHAGLGRPGPQAVSDSLQFAQAWTLCQYR